jgi:8-oxo-dGTP pyrophosphatase MutT (NUDIX family)
MMERATRQTASRTVYRNAWMTVREDDVVHPDGSAGVYGVVDKPDYALIVPVQDGGFHLVEQYRYPVGGRFWEFPQGSWATADRSREPADPMADAFALAAAELREETGLSARTMTYLGRLHVAYGYSSQGCRVFLAEDLEPGEAAREAAEGDMRQRWVSRAEWFDLVRTGAVTDASTLAAFSLFCLHGAG